MAWNKKHGEMIRQYLLRYRQTIAVAESVTAGWMQVALSSLPDAAQFFQGGITTYNLGQKSRHLAIEPIQAAACNCVSQEVADQMALGVENLFTSHGESASAVMLLRYLSPARNCLLSMRLPGKIN